MCSNCSSRREEHNEGSHNTNGLMVHKKWAITWDKNARILSWALGRGLNSTDFQNYWTDSAGTLQKSSSPPPKLFPTLIFPQNPFSFKKSKIFIVPPQISRKWKIRPCLRAKCLSIHFLGPTPVKISSVLLTVI